jgi:hypothetical protein
LTRIRPLSALIQASSVERVILTRSRPLSVATASTAALRVQLRRRALTVAPPGRDVISVASPRSLVAGASAASRALTGRGANRNLGG